MKQRLLVLILALMIVGSASLALACHKKGAMGLASKDPLSSTTDYVLFPTFMLASTSGTLGCENWDLVSLEQVQYIAANWEPLKEETAQGEGDHLVALSQLMGCAQEAQPSFQQLMHAHYPVLFSNTSQRTPEESTHDVLFQMKSLLKTHLSQTCQSGILPS